MTQTLSSPQVLCRPALESDYADIAEFCKGIWDGDDYVPEVWHRWLHDPNGLLATAEYDGHVIGCAKLTLLTQGQWWLEGFRVDPKHQGLKVGSRLHNYITDWWQERCDGIVRLMTNSESLSVHHLCEKTGFVKTHNVWGCKTTSLDEPTGNISLVTDVREAVTFALACESLRFTDNRIDLGWRVCTLTEQVIKDHSSDMADFPHAFYWWKDKQGLFSALEDRESGKPTLMVGVLACDMSDMPALLADIRRFAAREKCDEVFHIIFDLPQFASKFEAAGFAKHWDHNAFIYEKRHPVK